MAFAGLPNAKDRADIIAYIKEASKWALSFAAMRWSMNLLYQLLRKISLELQQPIPNFRRLKFDESTENLWATFLRNLQFERNISKLNYSNSKDQNQNFRNIFLLCLKFAKNSLNWYAHINHDLKLYLSRKSTFLFHLFVFINFTKKSMLFFQLLRSNNKTFLFY